MPSVTKYTWSLLLGNVAGNASPIHAALVHVPATLYPFAFAADIIGLAMEKFPMTALRQYATSRGLYAFSYYATAAALVATIPTAITGLAEYFAIDGVRNPAAQKTARWHSGLNVVASGIALFNFLAKRKAVDFQPYRFNVLLSGVGLAGIIASLYLGGHLVYKHGVGVRRMGISPDDKLAGNPNADLKRDLALPTIGKKDEQ
ncbi:uncharacterized protein EV422DRAFT_521104 [Fimicolochytrium jonesii]|uniref:uncharacterized protein n=1 Tax=Fimicolochytrium jonesii TaxID=1396493 RepID=UPI0022FE9388|nr:uncharacterized protein EV422DRAFT_521104 [Fimicolochytrium jonesii]KAI8823456.1 hypothetical protein EV422DRAFT_521104 [Fimicolochytrium jonesii]